MRTAGTNHTAAHTRTAVAEGMAQPPALQDAQAQQYQSLLRKEAAHNDLQHMIQCHSLILKLIALER